MVHSLERLIFVVPTDACVMSKRTSCSCFMVLSQLLGTAPIQTISALLKRIRS